MMHMRRLTKGGGINAEKIAKIKQEIDAPISMADFRGAMRNTSRSVSNADLGNYQNWMKEFGCT
jgi:hypothetical protein